MSDTLTSAPLLGGAVTVRGGTVQLGNADALASAHMDALVHQAVFGNEATQS